MPEIKHQFTGGKMNKDLDERLVPNGEYRDAMNIQVATSEGSDVGTAQNILGNFGIPNPEISVKNAITGITSGYTFKLPDNAVCVGAISDEKNDVMYYLVWTLEADYIFEWDGNSATDLVFVFVDKNKSILKFTNDMTITGINIIDGMLLWTDNINEPRKINIQRCIDGTSGNPSVQTKLVNGATGVKTDMEEKHITVIKKGPQVAPDMKLHTSRKLDKIYTATMDISSAQDLDGSENDFSDFGVSANWNDFSSVSTEGDNNTFYIKIYNALNGFGEEVSLNATTPTGGPLQGLTGWYENGSSYPPSLVGTKVTLQAYDDDGFPPGLPLTDFVIKGEVVSASPSGNTPLYNSQLAPPIGIGIQSTDTPETFFSNFMTLGIKATSVDGFPEKAEDGETRKYVIDLFDETEKLFEFKYPRFSYRYKYEDGEYSTFAPFTQVAFIPGAFDYHPRKGYNIGMTNRITKVDLYNIVTGDVPKDVVAIDVLFKDDSSPSVYVVDTIRPDDYALPGAPNLWNQMLETSADVTLPPVGFEIGKEAISSVVPSNQLLRPWDNVPKRALAQDVTGNRVVYANYVQNYDLLSLGGEKYVPNLNITTANNVLAAQNTLDPSTNVTTNTFKSIKSLREYQLGVVFLDEYGRETPVLSNASGTTRLDKLAGATANRFGVSFSSDDYPQSLTHFKFFVKETSTEYYNMAMDRWYSAGDSNIWLSFPSSDRNKIDIDTFLILKKGADKDTLVTAPARYKVLAIENDAPDFIKTTKRRAFTKNHGPGNPVSDIFGSTSLDMPFSGATDFKMNYRAFHGTSGQDLADTEDELWIEFGKLGSEVISNRYKINSITNSWVDAKTDIVDSDVFSVELDIPLGSDVDFITDDATGVSSSLVESGTIVNIYKYKVENLDRFDGRFFVKIYFDEVFRKNIETTLIGGGLRTGSSKRVYSMDSNHRDKHTKDLSRFATRGRGSSRWAAKNEWYPQNNLISGFDSSGTSVSGMHQYGYYTIDEFTSNALYFRRYREKHYTPYGEGSADENVEWQNDYGVRQTHIDGTTFTWETSTTLNDDYNVRALVHLESGGGEGQRNYDKSFHVGPNEGSTDGYWKDAKDWWKEFGYHADQGNQYKRMHGWIDEGCSGVTSMWQRAAGVVDFAGIDHDPVTAWSYIEASGGYASDEASSRDTEVWFVDAGPFIGTTASAGGALRFRNQNTYYSGSPMGTGIESGASHWNMALGFGGIKSKDWDGFSDIESFWNVGNWNNPISGPNGNYDDGATSDFVASINTGFRFRWKEDVDKGRVYTMNGTVTAGSLLRHSDGPILPGRWDDDVATYANRNWSTFRNPTWNFTDHDDLRSMAEGLSFNLTKNYRINHITPALDWNPSSDGIIDGGLKLELECTDHNGFGSSTGNTATGWQCFGDGADDLCVYVHKITVYDTDIKANVTLHKGMALTSWRMTNASGDYHTPGNPKYIVRDIEKLNADTDEQCFKLTLGGYKVPLLQIDHNNLRGVNTTYSGQNGFDTNILSPPIVGEIIVFKQVGMNGYSPNSEFNINTISRYNEGPDGNVYGAIGAVGYTLEFVEEIQPTEVLSENPAIFETEPKESTDLDVYYEACGSIPTQINDSTVASAFPVGTKFLTGNNGSYTVIRHDGDKAVVYGNIAPAGNDIEFFRPDDLVITTSITSVTGSGPEYTIGFEANLMDNKFVLPWHNCYTFKNGVESNRIRDNFNLPYISNGVKASTTLEQEYKEEHRKYGLIYSGIYNSTSGINNLNQFIAAEKITKDVNPIYGSIQKLYSRDSDLVTLCEDKILKISADKDALYNADGNPQMIATNRVLGQTIPFSGEYGISTNPESFAAESYRAYFTDRVRGAVMRLSRDGLTPISDAGMKDYFRDNLRSAKRLLGSYDDRNDEYNLALNFENRNHFSDGAFDGGDKNKVLTFSERVGGWVSFKSFTDMQYGISLANDYYTFKNGVLYLHNSNETRNTFYGIFNPSTLDVVLNDFPSAVKVFNTLNYEGSQAHVDKFTSEVHDGTTYNDQEYHNLYKKEGWSVESIVTNKEEGKINEFLEKEGKWFNGINKIVDTSAKAETSDFTFQGIGVIGSGATDDDYVVSDDTTSGGPGGSAGPGGSTIDDDNTIDSDDTIDRGRVYGCTNSSATNYNPAANTDDGSCVLPIIKPTPDKPGFSSSTNNY